MKRKIIKLMAIFLLNIICIYSQDIVDPQRLFIKTSTNWEGLDLNEKIINENKFKLGWNWGSPSEKFDDALKIKYYHDYVENNNDVTDSVRIIEQLGMSGGRRCQNILNAFSAT
jgi:hypothetical protein